MTALTSSVAKILREDDADIAARKPVCRSSGRCCKFEQYGHSLFVTQAELILFAQTIQGDLLRSEFSIQNSPAKFISLPQFFAQPKPEGCPYQIDGLCTARDARPLGCRIYFCDENAQHWQAEVYEKYHSQLKALHQTFNIPYVYMEWRAALATLVNHDEAR